MHGRSTHAALSPIFLDVMSPSDDPRVVRWCVASVVAMTLLGCGEQGNRSTRPPEPSRDETTSVEPCEQNCLEAEPSPLPTNQQTPRVFAHPDELMFYGEAGSDIGLHTRPVTINNTTLSGVAVTHVYLMAYSEEDDDTGFFSIEVPDLSTPLQTGDSLEVMVSFIQSSIQRGALLVIETSHPSFRSLSVSLAGKVFY